MDTYTTSYAESGGSSPRSRETGFENPPLPSAPANHKVKFMVSYGGKIQPRLQDSQLSYAGGETKILYVDRSIKFPALISKLSSMIPADDSGVSLSSFKYQLPGEDLDALISVTNDDDLQHLMHEYDRLYRASPKPARLRIFVFPVQSSRYGSGSSDSDRDRFLELLNSAPVPVQDPIHANRVTGSQIEAQIQELNRLQISAPEQSYRVPVTIPVSVPELSSYRPVPAVRVEQRPVYVIHAPQPAASVYHAPPVMRAPTHAYYHMQRVPPESMYHEQQVAALSVPPATLPMPVRFSGYSEGISLPVRPVAGLPEPTGKRVYYATPPGGVTSSFQGASAPVNSGDMRTAGLIGVDGKIVSRVSPV